MKDRPCELDRLRAAKSLGQIKPLENIEADGAETLAANFIARESMLLDERDVPPEPAKPDRRR